MAHKKVKDMKPNQRKRVMATIRGRQANGSKTRRSRESDGFPAVDWRQYSVPLKYAAQIAFPYAAVPIEVGYIFLCSLDTIKAEYDVSESDRSRKLGRALSITIEKVGIQSIGYDAVSIIAEKSSEYLEQAQLFTTLTERLGLEESCSRDFRYFYETSLKSCLNQKFDEHVDWLR
uniref:Uncharacterized protein n=1 Tax=Candidatus Methanogaster sp. ANME-2c ERB4 TaxID=2759911 RepID=A0A7G9YNH7_9EURY|nr:hypothetical protein HIGBABBE_00034 [Methanosarcinales archaeon ANME-2c ERB4]